MIGEDYNEIEEEKNLNNRNKLTDSGTKKLKKSKIKSCTNCKELKLKIQALEQLNTKLEQANKNLKQTNKDTEQKLTEALKQNETLTKENARLQKLLQELDEGSIFKTIKKKSKKNVTKMYSSKDESSENEKENDEDKRKEEDNENRSTVEDNSQSFKKSQNNNAQKINPKNEKKNSKLANKNLVTNEVITDILDRLAELEKFRIYMEASAQTTDSKINFLESRMIEDSRRSSDDIGVPTTLKSKANNNKVPLISKSFNRIDKNSVNDDIDLSSSVMSNNYNYPNTAKKVKKDTDSKLLSENYIKSASPNRKQNMPFRFNSKILNDTEDLDLIALGLVLGDLEKLKNLKVGYKLIYRASIHGDSVKAFHKKCDNINGTLTVIKTKEGMIFGGFCSICWESGDELIKEDLNSFVFSINLSKIYFVSKNNDPSILCDKNKGPSFIGMFIINDNMLQSKCEINPWGTQRYSGESSPYEINGGESYFYIEEIEVFQVLFR